MARNTSLKSIVWQEGKHYVAQCLSVDVSSFGISKREALNNLHEALELYFEEEHKPRIAEVRRPEIVLSVLRNA